MVTREPRTPWLGPRQLGLRLPGLVLMGALASGVLSIDGVWADVVARLASLPRSCHAAATRTTKEAKLTDGRFERWRTKTEQIEVDWRAPDSYRVVLVFPEAMVPDAQGRMAKAEGESAMELAGL